MIRGATPASSPRKPRLISAASLKIKASFASAEAKRLFIRYFNTFQLGIHFISVISRNRLNHDDVANVEALVRSQMDKEAGELNKAIDGSEALFQAHGITSTATYDTVPPDLEVGGALVQQPPVQGLRRRCFLDGPRPPGTRLHG